ncbi:uncharacterized protein LAESUDRAFT_553422 [Laetiporus sulphureus 93-53]|uniref:F-box domain-containing protein n=1 Tax=Laetiporus sulphureus 93-53 TaxID=1314785 RepID=A0A165B8U2_9APHY|nr:uncharacterized protein LAESUDRAFT_553422 [Laetiporus sulphureus 93-53]KZT00508.1 hypothetical protein LAESUDRAFT_553422 [Laetiporus sulphureus 93-53]
MATSSPRVPAEISDYIIDLLRDDRATLSLCALTCHSWLLRAQKHAFRKVSLVSAERYEQLESLVLSNPRIASLILSLSIGPIQDPVGGRLDREWPLVLLKLNAVDELDVVGWAAGCVSEKVIRHLPVLFSEVRSIRLSQIHFWRPKAFDLFRMLCACPKLSALYLDRIQWQQLHGGRAGLFFITKNVPLGSVLAEIVPKQPMYIDTLQVTVCHRSIALWLIRGPLHLHVRRLTVSWSQQPATLIVLHSLLQAAGDYLDELTLELDARSFNARTESTLSHLDFSQNPRLSSLHVVFDGVESVDLPHLVVVHSLLRVVHRECQALRRITISLSRNDCDPAVIATLQRPPSVRAAAWQYVDAALATLAHGHPGITITIKVDWTQSPISWAEETAGRIIEKLPSIRRASCQLQVICGRSQDKISIFRGLSGGWQEFHKEYPCP